MNVLMILGCFLLVGALGLIFICAWRGKVIRTFKEQYRWELDWLQDQGKKLSEKIRAICQHTGRVRFCVDCTDGMGNVSVSGRKICLICGKVLKTYENMGDFMKDKAEYESKIRYEGLNQKKAEIDAELATLKKRDKKGKFTK